MKIGLGHELREAVNEQLNDDRGPMRCPVCGYDYSHVSVEKLGPAETGTRQGGYAVVLEGECGHTWGTVYAEHKGQVVEVPVVFEAIPVMSHREVLEAVYGAAEEMESGPGHG